MSHIYYQEDCEASNSSSGEDSPASDRVVLSPRKLHNKFLNVNKSKSKTNLKPCHSTRPKCKKCVSNRNFQSASSCDFDSVDDTFKTSRTRLTASSKNIAENSQKNLLPDQLNQHNKKQSKSRMPNQKRNSKSDAVQMIMFTKDVVTASGEGAVAIPPQDSDSKRVFPFCQTPSGNLKVGPNQVVFESQKVSVLVADPKNTKVNVRTESDNKIFNAGSPEESFPTIFGPEILFHQHIGGESNNTIDLHEPTYPKNSCTENYIDNSLPSRLAKEFSLQRLSATTLPPVDWNKTPLPLKTELFTRLLQRITNYINPDVEILISNEVFSCHLLVLQCYSDYFDQTQQASKVRLPEESVTPKAFMTIYNWMIYPGTDSFRLLSRENILELFIAAQNLGIKELEEQCWSFINSDHIFSEETAFLLYSKAKKLNNTTISQLMIPRIMRFFLKLVGTSNFVDLDLDDICTLLRSNFIAVHNEIEVFMSAVRWLMHDWVGRKTHLSEIMKCVRFGWIAPWQLVDIRRNPENPEFTRVTAHNDVQQLIEDGLSYAIIKYWYGNQTQDYYHWIDLLGLQEPCQRNWIDEEKNYVTYREFLNDLEVYQQAGYMERMHLRSQQLNTKVDTFPPPPTVAEFMAQRGKLTNGETEAHANCGDKSEKTDEIDELQSTNKTLPKQIMKDVFQKSNFSDIQSCFEKNAFLDSGNDEKNHDFEHHTYSKHIAENAENIMEKCSIKSQNKGFQTVPIDAIQQVHQETAFLPDEGVDSKKYSLDAKKIFMKKSDISSRWNKIVEHEKLGSFDELYTSSLLSKKSQPENSSLLPPVPKYSLHSLQSMNQVSNTSVMSSHRNYLMEGSLFFADEEAILVFGGIDPHRQYGLGRNTGKDVYRYQPHINSWELVGELPEPRHHHSVAFLRGKIFLAGGADPRDDDTEGKSKVVNTVWSYDPVSRKWLTESGMQTPRKNFGLVVSNSKLYAIGGQDKNGCILSSVERFNPASRIWEEMAPLSIGRMGIAAAKYRDFIWVAGGMTNSKTTSLSNIVECYDTRQNIWLSSGILRHSRCFSQLLAMNDNLYLIGGAGRINEDDTAASISCIDVWDESSKKWQLKGEMKIPRHGHSLAYLGTQILIIGGVTTMYMRALSNIECFCCIRGTWIHGVANLPTPLSGHGCVTLPPASLM